MKTNLKTLSESLKLSPTTVSRALDGYMDVSEATRKRVREAAEALGYHPDAAARRLATGRADVIGIIYPFGANDLGDPRFAEVVAGITDSLGAHNLDLVIASARSDSEIGTYRRLIKGRMVDALIVARTLVHDPRIEFLQEHRFPFVAYGRTNSSQPYAWFDFDNQAGARLAVERLVALGHSRIALIHAPLTINFAAQRHTGFCDAMRAAHRAIEEALMIEASFNRMGGYEAMRHLLAQDKPPTAVVVDNNLTGVGALRALGDAGKRPGEDVSLIVYDGIPADVPLAYRVTSVMQPAGDSSGHALAELVMAVLAGKPIESLHRLAMPCIEDGDTDNPPV